MTLIIKKPTSGKLVMAKVPSIAVTNGLVLYLDATRSDSYSGFGTAWNDISSSSNNATLTNGPTFSSANGGVIQFDGTNDYASNGTSSSLTPSAITFSVWVKRTAAWGSGSCLYWAKPNGNFAGNGFYVEPLTSGSGKTVVVFDGTPVPGAGGHLTSTANTSSLFPLNTFANFVFTLSSGVAAMYINGALTATTTTNTPTITSNTASKYIMHNSPSYNAYTPGEIGQILMYNRALTASEINNNYQVLRSRYGV